MGLRRSKPADAIFEKTRSLFWHFKVLNYLSLLDYMFELRAYRPGEDSIVKVKSQVHLRHTTGERSDVRGLQQDYKIIGKFTQQGSKMTVRPIKYPDQGHHLPRASYLQQG